MRLHDRLRAMLSGMDITDLTKAVVIDYTNHRGERSERRVLPLGQMRWGVSGWHRTPQWLMTAIDLDKDAYREFAMVDIHSMKPLTP